MGDAQFRRESAVDYFKELVDGALAHQGIATTEMTAFYVVQLLAGYARQPGAEAEAPLAFQLLHALDTGGARQRASLRQVGDLSLFISGFFGDSLRRKPVGVDYYVSIGGIAYDTLSRHEDDAFSPVFAELAEKFVQFVDVLSEISERTFCASNADLLRLYEKWLRTGSPRSAKLLVERGVVPNALARTSRVQ
jgi:hypothetical protein